MNWNQLSTSIRKGLIFAIVLIFMVLIDFEVIAATLISKVLGTNVLRGGIPEVKFMVIFLTLIGVWNGWSASNQSEKSSIGRKLLDGLFSGLAMGAAIALFDLLLNYLLQTNTDVRRYLAALSPESIKIFLLNLGYSGTLVHLALFTIMGVIGSALTIVAKSNFILKGWQWIRSLNNNVKENVNNKIPEVVKKYGIYIIYAGIIAIALILPNVWGSYNNYVAGLVGIYIILGIGLNIIVGLSGQLMLGFAAFFAMGAYSVGLLNAPLPHGIMLGFWPSLLIGIFVAIIAAIFLGLPIMRLRGDYLAIVTLGFGEIIRILLKSDLLTKFTGGPHGIQDIKGPQLFDKLGNSDVGYTYLIIIGVILSVFIYKRLENSRTGRAWLAIKEDATVAQATGINVQKYKLLALCIGAAFAGLAGGIFAARNQFTGPNDHTLMVSMNILSLVIVGGMNSIPGIVLGAFILKGLPEILREIENYRMLVFGGLLVVMMLFRPNGLWPASRPTLEQYNLPKTNKKIQLDKGKKNA